MTSSTAPATNRATGASRWLRSNRGRLALIAFFIFILLYAFSVMETDDWVITIIRGLAVGAITFLVASGLSLILGLMDVLNLAHGELYMLGAYIGWTIYVRPDTFLDALTPIALLLSTLALLPLWRHVASRWPRGKWPRIIVPVVAGVLGLALAIFLFSKFPMSIWNLDDYNQTPIVDAVAFDQGIQELPEHATFDGVPPIVGMIGMLFAGALLGIGIAGGIERKAEAVQPMPRKGTYIISGAVAALAIIVYAVNEPLTEWWYGLSTSPRFFFALFITALLAFGLGALIEVVFIRPLYDRLLYQIMMTLGLGFIIIELVREVWGRPEFTMPKPGVFNGRGDACPGEGFGGFFTGCSTVKLFGSRVRMYNEVFIILVGVIVLVTITLLIKKTRLGMIIRAGVQDSEMVEALGINVRRVFTLTFGLGVSLAAIGGVIAAPALGLSVGMGATVLLLAIIAMAIGGLTSFPGAAVGAVIVGLLQQFMIKFGSVGISLPWSDEPFKPSPVIVPASAILLMIVVLLILPNGLLGKEE